MQNRSEQSMAYMVLTHLNQTNKDTIEINNIDDQKWIEHYKSLWRSNSPQKNNDETETTPTPSAEIDEISDEELRTELEINEKQKSRWSRWFKF